MSKKTTKAKSQTANLSAKDLIAQIDKTLVELGKLTGYGPDYREAKAKWAELKAKFVASEKAKAAAPNKKAPGKVTSKTDPLKKPIASQPEPPKLDLPKPKAPSAVLVTPHSLVCYIGSFPVEALARRDASELLGNPRVFWYRRAMFPDPTAAKVQPKVMSAKVVERKGAQFTRSPYTVMVSIDIQGDAAHCKAWAEGVVNKNKGDQE